MPPGLPGNALPAGVAPRTSDATAAVFAFASTLVSGTPLREFFIAVVINLLLDFDLLDLFDNAALRELDRTLKAFP